MPDLRRNPSYAPEIIDRFWSRVNRSDDASCWLWTAGTARGYGQMCIGYTASGRQRNTTAHRMSWELHHGAIPDGLCVLHKCDVPRCVNPAHLFLGTQADNLSDARTKGRLVDGRGARKLSNDEYLAILTASRVRGNGRRLAAQFGVHLQTISRIWNGHYVHGPSLPEHRVAQHQAVKSQARPGRLNVVDQNVEPVAVRRVRVLGEVR